MTETASFDKLLHAAHSVVNPRELSQDASCGTVGAALQTDKGDVFLGVCIDTACSMGFCAEHAAAATMVTAGQNRVVRMVAVSCRGPVLPPCGRCREVISQLAPDNMDTQVLVAPGRVVALRTLLPFNSRSV